MAVRYGTCRVYMYNKLGWIYFVSAIFACLAIVLDAQPQILGLRTAFDQFYPSQSPFQQHGMQWGNVQSPQANRQMRIQQLMRQRKHLDNKIQRQNEELLRDLSSGSTSRNSFSHVKNNNSNTVNFNYDNRWRGNGQNSTQGRGGGGGTISGGNDNRPIRHNDINNNRRVVPNVLDGSIRSNENRVRNFNQLKSSNHNKHANNNNVDNNIQRRGQSRVQKGSRFNNGIPLQQKGAINNRPAQQWTGAQHHSAVNNKPAQQWTGAQQNSAINNKPAQQWTGAQQNSAINNAHAPQWTGTKSNQRVRQNTLAQNRINSRRRWRQNTNVGSRQKLTRSPEASEFVVQTLTRNNQASRHTAMPPSPTSSRHASTTNNKLQSRYNVQVQKELHSQTANTQANTLNDRLRQSNKTELEGNIARPTQNIKLLTPITVLNALTRSEGSSKQIILIRDRDGNFRLADTTQQPTPVKTNSNNDTISSKRAPQLIIPRLETNHNTGNRKVVSRPHTPIHVRAQPSEINHTPQMNNGHRHVDAVPPTSAVSSDTRSSGIGEKTIYEILQSLLEPNNIVQPVDARSQNYVPQSNVVQPIKAESQTYVVPQNNSVQSVNTVMQNDGTQRSNVVLPVSAVSQNYIPQNNVVQPASTVSQNYIPQNNVVQPASTVSQNYIPQNNVVQPASTVSQNYIPQNNVQPVNTVSQNYIPQNNVVQPVNTVSQIYVPQNNVVQPASTVLHSYMPQNNVVQPINTVSHNYMPHTTVVQPVSAAAHDTQQGYGVQSNMAAATATYQNPVPAVAPNPWLPVVNPFTGSNLSPFSSFATSNSGVGRWDGSTNGVPYQMSMMGISHGSQLSPMMQEMMFGDTIDPPDPPDPIPKPGQKPAAGQEIEAEDLPSTTVEPTTTTPPPPPTTTTTTAPTVTTSPVVPDSTTKQTSAIYGIAEQILSLFGGVSAGNLNHVVGNGNAKNTHTIDTSAQLNPAIVTAKQVKETNVATNAQIQDVYASPVEAMVAPVEATVAPVEAMVAPVEATVAPFDATVVPVDVTVTPVEDTSVFLSTFHANHGFGGIVAENISPETTTTYFNVPIARQPLPLITSTPPTTITTTDDPNKLVFDLLQSLRLLWDTRITPIPRPPKHLFSKTTTTTKTTTKKPTTTKATTTTTTTTTTTMPPTTVVPSTTPAPFTCTIQSPTFACKGKGLFALIQTMEAWCMGMCLKGRCVDTVCVCGCNYPDDRNIQTTDRKQQMTTSKPKPKRKTTTEPIPTTEEPPEEEEEIEAEDMVSTTTTGPTTTQIDFAVFTDPVFDVTITPYKTTVAPQTAKQSQIYQMQQNDVRAVKINNHVTLITDVAWGSEIKARFAQMAKNAGHVAEPKPAQVTGWNQPDPSSTPGLAVGWNRQPEPLAGTTTSPTIAYTTTERLPPNWSGTRWGLKLPPPIPASEKAKPSAKHLTQKQSPRALEWSTGHDPTPDQWHEPQPSPTPWQEPGGRRGNSRWNGGSRNTWRRPVGGSARGAWGRPPKLSETGPRDTRRHDVTFRDRSRDRGRFRLRNKWRQNTTPAGEEEEENEPPEGADK